mmetsp:Transcript_29536/g.53413  ORF Transcript_29536/g.53413 Transcript_29536/m.53413 type:complete len:162 (-) Transcript_29536:69-554(-)
MVRHKTRWLLLRLDFEHNVLRLPEVGANRKRRRRDDDSGTGLTKKDLAKCIRDSVASSFGIAASGIAQDLQVRLYDESSRLVIIRVARDSCDMVRVAICFTTVIQGKSVAASVVSVNGSARTAKRAALLELRQNFRQENFSMDKKSLVALEERLNMIQKIE